MPRGNILGDKSLGDKLLARALYRLERVPKARTLGESP